MSATTPIFDTATTEYLAAKFRRDATPYDIAAKCIGEVTENDRDGVRWRFAVMGGHQIGTIVAAVSGTRGGHRGMDIEPLELEARVEHFSGRFPRESRFGNLVAASPITLDL